MDDLLRIISYALDRWPVSASQITTFLSSPACGDPLGVGRVNSLQHCAGMTITQAHFLAQPIFGMKTIASLPVAAGRTPAAVT